MSEHQHFLHPPPVRRRRKEEGHGGGGGEEKKGFRSGAGEEGGVGQAAIDRQRIVSLILPKVWDPPDQYRAEPHLYSCV